MRLRKMTEIETRIASARSRAGNQGNNWSISFKFKSIPRDDGFTIGARDHGRDVVRHARLQLGMLEQVGHDQVRVGTSLDVQVRSACPSFSFVSLLNPVSCGTFLSSMIEPMCPSSFAFIHPVRDRRRRRSAAGLSPVLRASIPPALLGCRCLPRRFSAALALSARIFPPSGKSGPLTFSSSCAMVASGLSISSESTPSTLRPEYVRVECSSPCRRRCPMCR